MSSQYALIAGQWPELHEEALKVEQFALSDPRTACFYACRTIELLWSGCTTTIDRCSGLGVG
jgi:hypothetical protein